MSDYSILREYYKKYLTNVRGASEATVNHYLGALNTISKYLVEHKKVESSVYEINELCELELLREYLYDQSDFVAKDERGNRMYSAGLNNYIRFAEGKEFARLGDVGTQMDIVIPLSDKTTVTAERWKRNEIVKKQSIEMAHNLCEINSQHVTFTAASSGKQYMEGHHAIPIKKQSYFNVSLDVYANIICLCPICHRLLHYGVIDEKKDVLNKIYIDRADRLIASGIKMSCDEFIEMVK